MRVVVVGLSQRALASLIASVIVAAQFFVAALACPTCGCSEVCPIAMMEGESSDRSKSILTDSIWGNIILKMAYQRDPELQRLRKGRNFANAGTVDAIAGISAGTIAQNSISLATLNPPDGVEDSYVPGSIGLGLDAATNVAFTARLFLNHRYNKKIRAREMVIKQQVETILEHLEFSASKCPEAQKQLANLLGERAASDCVQLWQSSHTMADVPAKLQVGLNPDATAAPTASAAMVSKAIPVSPSR